MRDVRGGLLRAYGGFAGTNGWGVLEAGRLITGVAERTAAKELDRGWLPTVAAAFRDMDASCRALGGSDVQPRWAADSVNVASGNFFELEVDVPFGPLLGWLGVRRSYNSLDDAIGPFGPGWSSWASCGLWRSGSDGLVLRSPDGLVGVVGVDGAVPGFEGRVECDDGDGWVVRFRAVGVVWRFDAVGHPVHLAHGPGTGVTLDWDDDRLVRQVHERGRSVVFEWAGERIVGAVSDDGRRVAYGYDPGGRLVSVDGPTGGRRYEWDDRDRLCAVVDADGVVTVRNTYDPRGRVATRETPFGRRVRFWYGAGLVTEVDDDQGGPSNVWVHDQLGRPTRTVDGAGHATTKVYDRAGKPAAVTDRRGGTTRYTWDDQGRCVRIQRPDGTVADLVWDDQSRCVAVTRPGGAAVRFAYSGNERIPSEIVDAEGGVARMRVSGGLIHRIVDADGVSVGFDHDREGRMVAARDGTGARWRYEWDPTGQVTAVTSPLGSRREFQRDLAGRLTACCDPGGAEWRFERSPAGRVRAMVDPTGARRELRYGPRGELVEDIDPSGAVTSYRWNEHGEIAAILAPGGTRWGFDYDAATRLAQVTDPVGGRWLRDYDSEGALRSTITPAGVRRSIDVAVSGAIMAASDASARVRFEYDSVGRVSAQVRPDGSTVRVAYDRCDRVIAVTEASGGVTRFEYSAAGRLTAVVGPTGGRATFRYDRAGRLCETIDATGGRRQAVYDPDGRVVRVTGPTGETTRYRYGRNGQVTTTTHPGGGTTSYSYDPSGRLTTVTRPGGDATGYEHDRAGRLVTVTHPNGGKHRYVYDCAGRVASVTDPLGAHIRYRYDPAGRVAAVADPLGRVTTFRYNPDGRLVGRTGADGTRWWWRHDAATGALDAYGVGTSYTHLGYDTLGRLTRIIDNDMTVTRGWDPDGHLVTETIGDTAIRWLRDPVGNVTAATLRRGDAEVTTTYRLDTNSRPVAVDDATLGRVSIERDRCGRPTRITGAGFEERHVWRDGHLARWTRKRDGAPRLTVCYTRDKAGRITLERIRRKRTTRRTRYAYDPAGQLIAVDGPGGRWRFDYDAAGRLVGETSPEGQRRFRYDPAGQLTGITDSDDDRLIWPGVRTDDPVTVPLRAPDPLSGLSGHRVTVPLRPPDPLSGRSGLSGHQVTVPLRPPDPLSGRSGLSGHQVTLPLRPPDPLSDLSGHPWTRHACGHAGNTPVDHRQPTGLSALHVAAPRDHWDRGVWDHIGGYIVPGQDAGGLMATGAGEAPGVMLSGGGLARAELTGLAPVGRDLLASTADDMIGTIASCTLRGQHPLDPVCLGVRIATGRFLDGIGLYVV